MNFAINLTPQTQSTPTPTPTSTPSATPVGSHWINTAGGSFNTAANWNPATVPDSSHTAIFDPAAAYTVNIGSTVSDRLLISNGDVIFTNVAYTVGATSFDPPSVVLDNAKLTLADGALSSVHALIGESGASRVDVNANALWFNTGSLRVGGAGNGFLAIADGGEVTAGESRIGTGGGGGDVFIGGATAKWTAGTLAVGHDGSGSLTIDDGAVVTSEDSFVGFNANGSGQVILEGITTGGSPSNWDLSMHDLVIGNEGVGEVKVLDRSVLSGIDSLTIGKNVQGTLRVQQGAFVASNKGALGLGPSSGGLVVIEGSGNNVASTWSIADSLVVGSAGFVLVDVKDGGFLNAKTGVIGAATNSFGEVFVHGSSAGGESRLTIRDQLDVGGLGHGKLSVTEGGQAEIKGNLLRMAGTGSRSEIIVGGFDPITVVDAFIKVTGNFFMGADIGSNDHLSVLEDGEFFCGGIAHLGEDELGLAVAEIGSSGGAISASFSVALQLVVGDPGTGLIIMRNGAGVSAGGTILVGPHGGIFGTGTLSSLRLINGGFIQPGLSPGLLTVQGEFEQTAAGALRMEAAGLGNGKFDVLHVTGNATLAGRMEISFLNGYLPKAGDVIPFLQIDGTLTGSFTEITFPQLLPGFQIKTQLVGNTYEITALNDAVAAPTSLVNISTRLEVGLNDNVLIGGFILTGNTPKRVMVRAIGPSLNQAGVSGALTNPTLELHNGTDAVIASNDNWNVTQNGGVITNDQVGEILASTIAPSDGAESAIILTLGPGAYTAVIRGANNTTGIGLVEVYDLSPAIPTKLANISTRGVVQSADSVMIGGFIVGNQTSKVIVRAIGPSLPVSGALQDPTLELHDGSGALVAANDNWRSDQETEIIASTVPPTNDAESAIVRTLTPGNYTAITRGIGGTTGVGLVEVYNLP
jgi:T5SS/PEP-CTERM-associated repeat protein